MNSDLPSASITVSRRSRFSLTWLVPAIAIIVAGVLYFRWEMNRGPIVTINFQDTSGLAPESPIVYRGAIVGRVEDISLSMDLSSVVIRARLNASATNLACQGTRWWIVRPSVSLQGISGLDTIIGPRYIQLEPGNGEAKFSFTGSPVSLDTQGKHFVLITNVAKSITTGTPIFFRGVEIGEITSTELASDSTSVQLHFIIERQYTPLVRTNTIFWNVGGISIDAGLFGLNLHAGPLTSLIKGGISMATPEQVGDIAQVGFAFTLNDDFDKDWLEWSPTIDLSLQEEKE